MDRALVSRMPGARRTRLLIAALAAAAALIVAMAAGPVSQARATGAEYFCYASVGGYGTCIGNAHWLILVRSLGYQHSSCSDAWSGGPVQEWHCAAVNQWSNSYFDGSRWMQGAVKNNAAGTNQLWGYMEYN
jgi:hypothetical protein